MAIRIRNLGKTNRLLLETVVCCVSQLLVLYTKAYLFVPHRASNVSTGPYWEYLSSTHTCSVVQTEDDVTNSICSTFYIYYEDRYNIFMVAIVLVLIGRLHACFDNK